ncbi:DEAD/DEAH box helicase [Bdellovibrio sp. HCB2-146]|uniref:DEAD/DEAH box helicase n=1 Tax=Bdellovibrio sp. HCB2-146 TaxID=3394362 RepID=UPI0039BD0FD8
MTKIKFTDMPLVAPLQFALRESGYENPTPIQAEAIPHILEGHDLLGIAQTGTGKTAAFSLPLLQNLSKHSARTEPKRPRALVLAPTRELAIQIHESLETYGKHLKLRHGVIFGGVGQGNQVKALQSGVDVLVATPGRLFDLLEQKFVFLDKVEVFILDEADRMLDMGFLPDIHKILPLLPKRTHNLFFSATMPTEIQKLAHQILRNPKTVQVTPIATPAEKIEQSVMFVEKPNKLSLLLKVLEDNTYFKVLVFVDMKHAADRIVDKLVKAGIPTAGIHGDKSQGARQRAIEEFRTDKVRVLVATDIASRGLDIDNITHVINYDLPHLPENYIHRIGRTARAGMEGKALSFCTGEEKSFLFAIEKTMRVKVNVITDQPFHSEEASNAQVVSVGKAKAAIEARRIEARKQNFNRQRRHKAKTEKSGGGAGGKPGGGKGGGKKGGKKKPFMGRGK